MPLTHRNLFRLVSIRTSYIIYIRLTLANDLNLYLGKHLSLSKSSDLSDCSWGSLLELNTVESFVQIDCVVSGDWLDFLLLSFLYASHSNYQLINNISNLLVLFINLFITSLTRGFGVLG